jgi:cytochrome c-type biogenesis protein CcmH
MGFLLLSIVSFNTYAVVNGYKYPFENKTDELRFEALAEELRCPKCQNQNLADSNAPVAADLREKVYELMIEGQTDDEIVNYLVDRYGDFVRYNPAVQENTFFLWFGPGVMALIALIVIISITRSGKKSEPLTEEDKRKLAELKTKRPHSSSSLVTKNEKSEQ